MLVKNRNLDFIQKISVVCNLEQKIKSDCLTENKPDKLGKRKLR